MGMNKAVFWDFDGTLACSPALWSRSVLKSLQETVPGCGVSLEEIRPHMKTGFPWHTPYEDFSKVTDGLWWDRMFRHFCRVYSQFGIPEKDAERAALRVRDMLLDARNYSLCDGAVFILEKSGKLGYKNYILSNNFPELASVADALGLSGYFDGFIISAKVGYDKPRKEIFEFALRLAGSPEKRLMVGDSPEADIQGGRAAGMETVLVHKTADCGADHVFGGLSEIAGIL